MTAAHVVEGASKVSVKVPSGDVFSDVTLLAQDAARDFAILKVAGFELPEVKLGNSNNSKEGDAVIVIGTPLGEEALTNSLSTGIVSGIRDTGDGYKVIQITAPVSKGNSGGPAFNEAGEVIGMVVFKITAGESLNFLLPINYVRGVLAETDFRKPIGRFGYLTPSAPAAKREVKFKDSVWKDVKTGHVMTVRIEGDEIFFETDPESTPERWIVAERGSAKLGSSRTEYVGSITRTHYFFKDCGLWSFAVGACEQESLRCVGSFEIRMKTVSESKIDIVMSAFPLGTKFNGKCKASKSPETVSSTWLSIN